MILPYDMQFKHAGSGDDSSDYEKDHSSCSDSDSDKELPAKSYEVSARRQSRSLNPPRRRSHSPPAAKAHPAADVPSVEHNEHGSPAMRAAYGSILENRYAQPVRSAWIHSEPPALSPTLRPPLEPLAKTL